MEKNDSTRLSSESLSGEEVDLQGNGSSLRSNDPDKVEEMTEDLKLGIEFSSHESAYVAYVKYGAKHGFDVRKHHRKTNKMGLVSRVTYVCSKQGHRRKDNKRCESITYSLPSSRVGCEAHMVCLLMKTGKFKIISFNASHNHDLIKAPMKHMLKVNRCLSRAQKGHVADGEKSRSPIKETVELVSREVEGQENLGSGDNDYQNYLQRKRKLKMEKGDAGAILQYFQNMREDNSSCFYSVQLDEDDRITNIFWADARSVCDYKAFGDVVCFDTTYQINEYGRPFAPLIGVNHHKQIVVFGAALLYDDSRDSFKWLFETFLAAMSGKQPKTILTDQSAATAEAILEVFPEANHRLCAWHIYQKAAKNLSHVFHASKQFACDLSKCVYEYEDKDAWLSAWNDMLEKYDLKEDNWLKEIYEVREKWALVYERHTFTADLMSIQHKESITNVLKKHLMPSHDLLCFFEHFENILADRRDKELQADFKMMQTVPSPVINVEMLEHAVEVYTPEVFRLFEKEYMGILNCSVYKIGKSGTTSEYKVCYRSHEHLVKYDSSTQAVNCSCMKFTFVGILCSHALKVLDKKNVKTIPPDYILKRWTRGARDRSLTSYHGIETSDNPKESPGKRYSHLCHNFREIASLAAEDERLTACAHDWSVQLLKSLEEMKKNLGLDNVPVHKNSEGEALVGESGGTNQVKMVKHNDCEITKERGVKRKYTARCPCSRLTEPAETQKHIPPTKGTQSAARHWLLEGSSVGARTQVSLPSHRFDASATVNLQGTLPFTQRLQGSYVDNRNQVSYSSRTFGATPSFLNNMHFTQLCQEPSRHHNHCSPSKGGKESGN
ncbi:protein FAR1-RELATED SEQUENCE 5-like isoform X1 [Malus sylvestris]|uniref:protein FAR1-RELATED SEQUENCE 5-like isoform X1 n=1 Tax=Malus sylvestris TaxID=3752 RepID=UPI0021ACD780|nr:protein FAR1-RELATED SEQUENCE 5-like isoform X1 [Malus sylvestris]